MSKLNVLAFDLRIRGDKDLQSRVKALPANDAEGLVKLGTEYGFDFTTSELLGVVGAARKSDELSSEQLDQVTGGALNAYTPPGAFIGFHLSDPPSELPQQSKLQK